MDEGLLVAEDMQSSEVRRQPPRRRCNGTKTSNIYLGLLFETHDDSGSDAFQPTNTINTDGLESSQCSSLVSSPASTSKTYQPRSKDRVAPVATNTEGPKTNQGSSLVSSHQPTIEITQPLSLNRETPITPGVHHPLSRSDNAMLALTDSLAQRIADMAVACPFIIGETMALIRTRGLELKCDILTKTVQVWCLPRFLVGGSHQRRTIRIPSSLISPCTSKRDNKWRKLPRIHIYH